MIKIIFLSVLFYSLNICAHGEVLPPNKTPAEITSVDVNRYYVENVNRQDIKDLVEKEEKVNKCIIEYINKQERSWAKSNQNNLYDLINNFSKIILKVSGKQQVKDDISYKDKLEILANVQCDVYFNMGILK